jgi:hypothetical protein
VLLAPLEKGEPVNPFTGISTAWFLANIFNNADAHSLFYGPNPSILAVSGWTGERFKETQGCRSIPSQVVVPGGGAREGTAALRLRASRRSPSPQ